MTKYRGTTQWREVNGLLMPARLPEKIGLGCPNCDDHVLVQFTQVQMGANDSRVATFVKKHDTCKAPLQTLEIHDGRLLITGELREKSS